MLIRPRSDGRIRISRIRTLPMFKSRIPSTIATASLAGLPEVVPADTKVTAILNYVGTTWGMRTLDASPRGGDACRRHVRRSPVRSAHRSCVMSTSPPVQRLVTAVVALTRLSAVAGAEPQISNHMRGVSRGHDPTAHGNNDGGSPYPDCRRDDPVDVQFYREPDRTLSDLPHRIEFNHCAAHGWLKLSGYGFIDHRWRSRVRAPIYICDLR